MDPLDAVLDRELRTLLAAEPSPDFVARTRARIAEEPAPAWWRWSWTLAAVAAVFVAAVAGAVLARFGAAPVGLPTPVLAARTIVEASGALVVPFVPSRLLRTTVASGVSRTSPRADTRAEAEPEVLIDPREARALRRLLNGIRRHEIDPSIVPDMPDLSAFAIDNSAPAVGGGRP
jgi:hypothetical protein